MKLFIQSLNFLTGLMFLLISSIAIAAPSKQAFYENASFEKVEAFIVQIAQGKKQAESKNGNTAKDHLNNIANVFLTAVFVKHPDYIKTIQGKFNQYPEEEKLIFANALIIIEGKDILNKLHYSIPVEIKLLSINDIDKIDLTNLKKEGELYVLCGIVDYLWSAFEATGDDKYLKNILNYLASEPLIVRKHAFRDDVEPEINELVKKDTRYSFEKLLTYRTILWSMESQRMQHPDIEAKVQKILKQKPNLNYKKGIE